MKNIRYLTLICFILLLSGNRQAQTTQPPITNPPLRQELINRVKKDQEVRNEWIKKGVLSKDKTLLRRMEAIDADNTARMKTIVKQYGWPGPELVGQDGTEAAFLLAQHADHGFQKELLPLIRESYEAKKLSGQNYALFLDRVLVGEGKPQVYGTQAKPIEQWKGKEPVLQAIEDEGNVDKRRAEVGLPSISEYLKLLKQMYFPPDKQK